MVFSKVILALGAIIAFALCLNAQATYQQIETINQDKFFKLINDNNYPGGVVYPTETGFGGGLVEYWYINTKDILPYQLIMAFLDRTAQVPAPEFPVYQYRNPTLKYDSLDLVQFQLSNTTVPVCYKKDPSCNLSGGVQNLYCQVTCPQKEYPPRY